MSYVMACGDVVPGCPATFEGDTREELLAKVGAHANAEHADAGAPPSCDVVDGAVKKVL